MSSFLKMYTVLGFEILFHKQLKKNWNKFCVKISNSYYLILIRLILFFSIQIHIIVKGRHSDFYYMLLKIINVQTRPVYSELSQLFEHLKIFQKTKNNHGARGKKKSFPLIFLNTLEEPGFNFELLFDYWIRFKPHLDQVFLGEILKFELSLDLKLNYYLIIEIASNPI